MAKLSPYLAFNGNCREAMNFYKSVFGGKLDIKELDGTPMAAQMGAEMKGKVMHSSLMNGKFDLMASDMFGDEDVKRGNTISLCLVCGNKEEIESLYKKLVEGGRVEHELKAEFFGTYGDLTDKYGFRWMLQFPGEMKQ